ncbi:PTS transporter subunit EIIB, partial [Klebsiella pneumoniae]|uniref:PTS transporter subunit EIIB n=1 Tax=Klebsiella pneumoniae TaxID=573 RepID=UPI003B5B2423
ILPMIYQPLAEFIINRVGGPENITSLTHWATRLRFQLRKYDVVLKDDLSNHPEIIMVVESGGQLQVIVGNNVSEVYKAIEATGITDQTDLAAGSSDEAV